MLPLQGVAASWVLVTIFVLITLSQWSLAVISYVILYGFRTCSSNTANEISISIECLTLVV